MDDEVRGDCKNGSGLPCPSENDLGLAYAVLVCDRTEYAQDSNELTADGLDAHVALRRANANKMHAARVYAADATLLASERMCEAMQRARIQRDYSLALIIIFLRAEHAAERNHARVFGRRRGSSGAGGVAEPRWCAVWARPRSARSASSRARVPVAVIRPTPRVPTAAPPRNVGRAVCRSVARSPPPRRRSDVKAGNRWSELFAKFAGCVFKGDSTYELTSHMNSCLAVVKFAIAERVDVTTVLVQDGMYAGIAKLTRQLYAWASRGGKTSEDVQTAASNVCIRARGSGRAYCRVWGEHAPLFLK